MLRKKIIPDKNIRIINIDLTGYPITEAVIKDKAKLHPRLKKVKKENAGICVIVYYSIEGIEQKPLKYYYK